MDRLLTHVRLTVTEQVYLKDPESTRLGREIIENSILLIEELGLESFTFKKLAQKINSTEASVYRYFENKHKLLIYLVSWYWVWLEYFLVFNLNNLEDPKEKLRRAIRILTSPILPDPTFSHIDESVLHKIVVSESSKAYLTKAVDEDNREGYFAGYKSLCKRVANIIREINPKYKYPTALVSTIVEAAHHQNYFSEHLPSLTEVSKGNEEALNDFLISMALTALERES